MNHHDTFADRLIAAEQMDAKRKERYEMEMRKILTQTLTPARRTAYAVGAILGLLFAVDYGWLAATLHITGEYAVWGRVAFGAFALLALGWTVVAGRIAIRGTLSLTTDRTMTARLLWYLCVLISIVALCVGGLELTYGSGKWAVFTAVIGLAYLIAGALFVIRNLVQQSELRIREKLLEIELRLAELNEELGRRSG